MNVWYHIIPKYFEYETQTLYYLDVNVCLYICDILCKLLLFKNHYNEINIFFLNIYIMFIFTSKKSIS